MKRHSGLQALSRDHHHALVLARGLRRDTPAGLRGGLPSEPTALVAEAKRRYELELAPHFRLEERELWPLALCAGDAARAAAADLIAQHHALEASIAELTPEGCDRLGEALNAHVRFEEQVLFPALEAALDDDLLSELAFRLQIVPEVAIVDFERDDEGVWVARLACGHGRHVRHNPPFQEAAWVTSAQGRRERLGARSPCGLCRMPRMPSCAQVYKRSPVFDQASIPAGLLRSHRLREDTWGRIVVLAGRVQYILEDEGDHTLVLRPGVDGVVAPGRPHRVALDREARLQVHFYRQ